MTKHLPAAPSIMVVDDEPENLRIFESLLSAAGLGVRAFPSGRLALAAAHRDPPELLLLDIRMPEMDGYEVCSLFQQSPVLRQVPVIFVSALNETSDVVRGFRVGGADYVVKPVREEELLARVRLHLSLRHVQHELKARNEELDEQYNRLRTLEQKRDEWVHMLVHDLRSPLQGMSLMLQFLVEAGGTLSEPERQEHLQEIFETTRTVSHMLQTILDVSRLEVGKMPINRVALDAQTLLQDAIQTLGGLTLGRELRVEPLASPIGFEGDRDLCVRIMANLINNALKYTPADRPVIVGATAQPAETRLWVRDQGPGIAAQDHARVFEKYAGVRHEGVPVPTVGLGLAFCRLAAQAHGGRIDIASLPGEGSTFSLVLPQKTKET